MSECDEGRHLAVGAGAPADPDLLTDGPVAESGDGGPVRAADRAGASGPGASGPSTGEVLQAVVDFVDDLVEITGGVADGVCPKSLAAAEGVATREGGDTPPADAIGGDS